MFVKENPDRKKNIVERRWVWKVVKKGNFTAADQSKLVSHTDSSSQEEEDLHVDVNFDEPVDLAIN